MKLNNEQDLDQSINTNILNELLQGNVLLDDTIEKIKLCNYIKVKFISNFYP